MIQTSQPCNLRLKSNRSVRDAKTTVKTAGVRGERQFGHAGEAARVKSMIVVISKGSISPMKKTLWEDMLIHALMRDMLDMVLVISPAPYYCEGWKNSNRLVSVLWRVTGIANGMIVLDTESQALGLRLMIPTKYIDSFREMDLHLHYPPSKRQGVLFLKGRWVIPPEGNLPWYVPRRRSGARRRLKASPTGTST